MAKKATNYLSYPKGEFLIARRVMHLTAFFELKGFPVEAGI